MAVLNSTGQLLLPMVGITKDELIRYKVEIKDVGFRFAKVSRKSQPYAIFIRIEKNPDFVSFLDNNRSLLQVHNENQQQVLLMECMPDYTDDWELVMKGKYSLVSFATRSKILKGVEKNKDFWERVFRREEKDVLAHIESKLKGPKYTPLKRRKVAKELFEDINMDTYELYPKLKKDFV